MPLLSQKFPGDRDAIFRIISTSRYVRSARRISRFFAAVAIADIMAK